MRHRSLTHGRYSVRILVPGPAIVSGDCHDAIQPVHTKGQCSGQAYSRGSAIFETRLIFNVIFVMLQVAVENFFY